MDIISYNIWVDKYIWITVNYNNNPIVITFTHLTHTHLTPTMAPSKTPQPASSNAIHSLWSAYIQNTSSRLKTIDAFLLFLMLSGVLQFLYCILVTNYPFNAFLAGYILLLLPSFNATNSLLQLPASLATLASSSSQPHCAPKSTLRTVQNSKMFPRNGA